MTVHALHAPDSDLGWSLYTCLSNGKVEVLSIEGWAYYTDQVMSKEDARAHYRKMQAAGRVAKVPPANINVGRLRAIIRD